MVDLALKEPLVWGLALKKPLVLAMIVVLAIFNNGSSCGFTNRQGK